MTKPTRLILHQSFRYVPAVATSVAETWRRFGWRPTTDEERKSRARPAAEMLVEEIAVVRPIRWRTPCLPVENAMEREPMVFPESSTG